MADENKKAVAKADTSETAKSEKKEKKEKKPKQHKVKRFFKDLRGETKKIVWPGRKMVIKSTGVVLVAILIIGAGIWVIDYALSGALKAFNEAADAEPTTQVVETTNAPAVITTEAAVDTTETEDTSDTSEVSEEETTEASAETTTNA